MRQHIRSHRASSPRTRRYFQARTHPKLSQQLFSAHAEVFPVIWPDSRSRTPLLRARGGISYRKRRTPPPHRLFSAHAEVFPAKNRRGLLLTSLLRARGGISNNPRLAAPVDGSSPRTRRYFRRTLYARRWRNLFSAHAEVFPALSAPYLTGLALLRARGGISISCNLGSLNVNSSPRTRRYFPRHRDGAYSMRLFSAHAEVFPDNH